MKIALNLMLLYTLLNTFLSASGSNKSVVVTYYDNKGPHNVKFKKVQDILKLNKEKVDFVKISLEGSFISLNYYQDGRWLKLPKLGSDNVALIESLKTLLDMDDRISVKLRTQGGYLVKTRKSVKFFSCKHIFPMNTGALFVKNGNVYGKKGGSRNAFIKIAPLRDLSPAALTLLDIKI
jgi:hypothetical protein